MADRLQLANDGEEAFRLAFEGQQSTMWTALPAIVTSINYAEMTCECQPAIQGVIEDQTGLQTTINLPKLIHVPICFPKGGGFVLTLPLAAGDEILVVIASRCIDSWWQSGGINVPAEFRMHDLSDGFCIPGPCSLPNVVPNISQTGAQLRNVAGTSYVELSADGSIKLVSPTGIKVTGNLTVTGTVVASGEVTGNSIPLSAHLHSGVSSGTGNTGPAIP